MGRSYLLRSDENALIYDKMQVFIKLILVLYHFKGYLMSFSCNHGNG